MKDRGVLREVGGQRFFEKWTASDTVEQRDLNGRLIAVWKWVKDEPIPDPPETVITPDGPGEGRFLFLEDDNL